MTGTSASPRRAAATCLLAAALAGCGSSSGGNSTANSTPAAPSTTAAATTTSGGSPSTSALVITIKNFAYSTPASVSPGATITVRNQDPTEHTVTADSGSAFDVQVSSGGTATFTAPTQPGSYPFHCSIHPFMKGTLVVT